MRIGESQHSPAFQGVPEWGPFLPSRFVSISVTTLFFAAYRDLVGTGELVVELREGATVGDLVKELRARGAPYDALPASRRSR